MPPQVRTSKQAFGQTLFRGLGQVLSNIPQVIQAQKQQMQADAIERFKISIQAMQFQRQQQQTRANILRLNSASRLNNLKIQDLMRIKPTPEEEAESARKLADAEASAKIGAFTGFFGSDEGKEVISGLGGRGLNIPGIGSITNAPQRPDVAVDREQRLTDAALDTKTLAEARLALDNEKFISSQLGTAFNSLLKLKGDLIKQTNEFDLLFGSDATPEQLERQNNNLLLIEQLDSQIKEVLSQQTANILPAGGDANVVPLQELVNQLNNNQIQLSDLTPEQLEALESSGLIQ